MSTSDIFSTSAGSAPQMDRAETTPEIVRQLAARIPTDTHYADVLPEDLRPTLKAIQLYNGYRAPMERGLAGLPNTSAKLVSLGVFYIDNNEVVLHPLLQQAFDAKDAARDALLVRLQQLSHEHTVN